MTARAALCTALCLALLSGAASAFELWSDESGERSLDLNTTVKWTSLLSRAPDDTTLFPEEWTAAALWRGRIALDARPHPGIRVDVAYEVRARVESEAGGGGGALVLPSTLPAPYRIRQLDDDIIETMEGLTLRHELDRASVNLAFGNADVTVGRQAVGWGRGLYFSVVDIFAPFSPLESDREWRRGIDAVRFRLPFTDLWTLDAVGAFDEREEQSSFAARAHGYVGDIDGELLFGSRREAVFYAATASMPLFDAEIHGEAAVFIEPEGVTFVGTDAGRLDGLDQAPRRGPAWDDPSKQDAVLKALVGTSRSFDVLAGLYMVAEYHYSGYGLEDPTTVTELDESSPFFDRYLRGDTQMLGRHAVAVQATYGFAGTAPISVTWLGSPVDGSGVFIPAVSWSFSDSITLTAQAYFALGEDSADGELRSEYGATPASVLAQISFYY